jgi:hypothetical protein
MEIDTKDILEEFYKNFNNDYGGCFECCEAEDLLNKTEQFILSALEQKDIECLENKEKLLNDYSDWLHKKGYIDTDYYSEEPKAVEEYLGIK